MYKFLPPLEKAKYKEALNKAIGVKKDSFELGFRPKGLPAVQKQNYIQITQPDGSQRLISTKPKEKEPTQEEIERENKLNADQIAIE